MQINLSGHHVTITDGIRDVVNTKFDKVSLHFPQLSSINVSITVERTEQSIEVSGQYLGAPVAVQAANKDLYAAIASAAKKLESTLRHRKGSIKSNLHDKPELDDTEQDDTELSEAS